MKKYNASISIYFVFAIILIISVVMSVTEIARINCQKLYLQIATDASIDSMASLYHRKLYEYYDLYGVEYRTKDMLENEYLEYLYPYFTDDDRYIRNWYIAKIDEENVNFSFKTLVDENNFEKEIISYMKYKLIGKVIKFLGKEIFVENENDLEVFLEESKDIFEETEKSSLYSEIYERYFNFTRGIKNLENSAKKISEYVDKVNLSINSIKILSTAGNKQNIDNAVRKINELKSNVNSLNNYLNKYKNDMADFRDLVNESYDKYQLDKVTERYEFNDEINEFVESEFEHFLSFVDEESDMNKAIAEGFRNCNDIVRIINEQASDLNELATDFMSIEDDIKSARRDGDDDLVQELQEEKKELQDEISDCIKDIKETYKDAVMEDINIAISTTNHSDKENLLDKLIGFKNGVLINLILSNEKIENIDKDSQAYSSFNILSQNNYISLNKIMLGEYELDKFNYYNKDLNEEITASGSKKLEVERLIVGNTSDIENIKGVINQIFVIRLAMNVLHIYKSTQKRQAARHFSAILFSGFSPLMVEIMFLVMITAWGAAQSIVDLKKIMANKRVKFIHDNESWTVSVENILNVASNQFLDEENDADDGGFALDYKDYLRLLLISSNQSDVDARMASIIENNIKSEQESFDFEKLIYSFTVNNTFLCRHFFTNFVFVDAKDVELYNEYKINTEAFRSYYDD